METNARVPYNLALFITFANFSTKLHIFTKFMMLFPAVLMNFPNSEVCLIGEWSIEIYCASYDAMVMNKIDERDAGF